MVEHMTGKNFQPSALAAGFFVTLVCLSLTVSAASGIPIPLSKPFIGPTPLQKPEYVEVMTSASTDPDSPAINFVCHRIGNKLASVSVEECLAASFSSSGNSSLGTPILSNEYGDDSSETIKARVLLVGGTHGDEYSSTSVVFKWLAFLESDTHDFRWRVAPLLNPDGLLRKKSSRTNANGVDLNRNLPTPNWRQESKHHWVNKTGSNPRRYPGANALSEPENRWLVAEIASFQPDVIISTHAPHGIVDFDGPPQGPTQIGALVQRFLGTYPGSLGNYAGLQLGLPVVTIEFKSAGSMPRPEEIERMWHDLLGWLESRFPENPDEDALRADASQI